ncbi:hypothetical protein Pla144_29670 [Bythopirellula polymerisocia]|uniref:Uncharacterized protein n=1 Tax=Bythopirellula polymerisocia TaxID=2528003 RepID=A0A5C6CNS3_9BACT|nr:hypothetical protein Pla144_29670 [Bythopirellula polymerisocia]
MYEIKGRLGSSFFDGIAIFIAKEWIYQLAAYLSKVGLLGQMNVTKASTGKRESLEIRPCERESNLLGLLKRPILWDIIQISRESGIIPTSVQCGP